VARRTTEADTATQVGVSTKTLQRYRNRKEDPVPHDEIGGRFFYTPSEVRAWMDRNGLTGQHGAAKVEPGRTGLVRPAEPAAEPPPAAPAAPPDRGLLVSLPSPGAREGAQARETIQKADAAARVAKATKAQLEVQAEKGLAELGLDREIQAAATNEDLAKLGLKVGSFVALGKLTPERGRAINDLIKEARQNLKATAKAPASQFDTALLATADGAALLRVFEGIVDPDRRAQVRAFADQVAEEDRAAGPRADTVAGGQEAARE
jgi:hypothetical protein